ncbi:MAG: GYD domain-containing protein [Chloroflexi bacterium]|nr:GYD domain-containing protein [Chloroflexota bacterium]
MPKYLVQASYTADGLKGLLKDGGSKRRAAVEQMVSALGGKVEAFYFAFGETDVFTIIDAPDNATVAAASLVASASGAVQVRTTVLLAPEEIDQATRKSVSYQPPGA